MANMATTVLPEPDVVALHELAHPLAGGQVGPDLAGGAHLRAGEPERQVGLDLVGEGAGRDDPGRLGAAGGFALRQRQLVGEQFVEGEAAAHGR